MSGEVLVVDASPLILLAKIDALALLPALSKQVVAPRAVAQEIASGAALEPRLGGLAGAAWLRIEEGIAIPQGVAAWDLGAGESQ